MWNDIDGKNVGVPGGAYIISNNQPIALPATGGCSYPHLIYCFFVFLFLVFVCVCISSKEFD